MAEGKGVTMTTHISKRQAHGLFLAAKFNEQAMYPAAQKHYDEHRTWPAEYLAAQHETARAFERYVDAGIFSGITIPVEG